MNGEGMVKAVQGMTLDEKLVFLISEVGTLKTAVVAHARAVSDALEDINDMRLEYAKTPDECKQRFKDFDTRIGELESKAVGDRAVTKFLFGTSGISVLALLMIVLKLFGVF